MDRILTSYLFFQNIIVLNWPGVAVFSDIIKIITIFVKKIFQDLIKVKRIRNYVSK